MSSTIPMPMPGGNVTCGRLGYNGQLQESFTRWQFLGNGYRVYNPTLMRFHSPDSVSPFGEGGINAYAYCAGDPINCSDPSGHFLLGLAAAMGFGAVGAGAVSAALVMRGEDKMAGLFGTIAGLFGAAAMVAGGAHAFRALSMKPGPIRTGARVKNPDLAHGDVVIWRMRDRDVVRVHGNKRYVELKPGQGSSGKDLAELYMGTPMGRARKVLVEIQSCYGGRGRRNVAQDFANAAGVDVLAYDELVNVVGGVKQLAEHRQPVVFRPQTGPGKAALADRKEALSRRARRLRSQRT